MEPSIDVEEMFKQITEANSEDHVLERVDEAIPEYLHDGWEEDFDSEYDAYVETGNGEAESQVLRELMGDLPDCEHWHELYDKLKEHYGI